MPIVEQLRDKAHALEQLLADHLGGLEVKWQLPPSLPLHFRTRILYPVRPGSDGRPIVGIYQPRSHELVRVRECKTQDRGLTLLGTRAEQILRDLELEPWDETQQTGFVRAFAARLAPGTGELLMGIVTRPGIFEQSAELAERLFEAATDLPHEGRTRTQPVGVVRSISERTGNYLFGDRNVPLKGRDHQLDIADGLRFRIRFSSFYQIHRNSNAVLYREALAMAGDLRGQRVVDGYGGIGTFGLRCMKRGAADVEIIEENPVACGDAEHNAKANGFDAVRVIRARFDEATIAADPDLLIVDPPRSGLGPGGIAKVLATRPAKLLCVHCSADALARDLGPLTEAGYRVVEVRLCDMFPHTDHVEVVTLLLP
jgi:23S rRNA (uracil1939-C5)-methyltransferase